MTYEHYSAEWLAAHCDSESAFERAVKRQLARLLEENEDYRRTCEHLLRQTCEQIGEIVALTEQRDELLAALRRIADTSANQSGTGAQWVHWVDQARDAIAKAGGAA